MSAVLRKVLFWLLLLALPLHGIASSVMPTRAAGHVTVQAQGAREAASMEMAGFTMNAAKDKDCAGMSAGCDHLRSAGLFKCGLSAACALVAAPDLQRPRILHLPTSQDAVAPYLHLQVAFCTGAPERPPRFLA